MSRPAGSGGDDALGRAIALVVLAAITTTMLPALLGGYGIASLLRRHQLRFTWALIGGGPAALPLIAVGPGDAATSLHAAATAVVDASAPGFGTWLAGPVVVWLPLTAVAAAAFKLWRDRRDQLHGGLAEQRHAQAVGPLEWVARRRAQRRDALDPACTRAGVRLGRDAQGRPVRVAPLVAHATIVGGSNTGKTNTAAVLLEGMVESGAGFVVLDGKGGRDLPHAALALSERYGRPVALWSVLPYGDPHLDRHRYRWNVTGGGNPTEIKDRIGTSEEQTEPYYEAVGARGTLAAIQAITARGATARLDVLSRLLDSPGLLRDFLTRADPVRFRADIDWLANLGDGETSGLRGIGLRLHTMIASDGGEWLLPADDGREIDLYRAIREGWLVVFTLPQGSYPKLIPHVTRYAISAVNAVAGQLEREGIVANSVLFVDELSAFDGDQLASTLERARSSGIRCVLATQSLSNFETSGDVKLLHAALDNAELVVIHRQAVPESVDVLAALAGTEEAWEHTHKIDDTAGIGRIGWDEVGERNRRLTDRYRAHPNTIKQLGLGQAIVISQRPHFAVHRLTIARGLTTRHFGRR